MATKETAPATPKAPEPKTVREDMDNRRVFPTVEEATQYLVASYETYADFKDMTLAAPGVDAEMNFDPAIYTDSMDVMVSLLRKGSAIKAIVVAPVPKIATLLDSPEAMLWVEKILRKEQNHVAVRALREAEDVSTVIDQMPTTLEGYLASGRDGGGGIMEAFNELYKGINATMSNALPVWTKARLIKSELKHCFESKGYAAEWKPALENYAGKGSEHGLFVTALGLAINAAKRKGLDPTIFERWLATRDAKVFTPGEAEDDEDLLDLDSLTTALLAEGTADSDKPAEAAATTDAAPTGTDAATTEQAPAA